MPTIKPSPCYILALYPSKILPTMADRPVFAFETSFLDCLTQHYDMCLDPTNSAYPSTSTHNPRQEASQQHATENHRPIPRSAQRVSSTGSASSSAPGSLWFLRKRKKNTKTSFRPPANSLNSLNSLGSLNSMNSFLKGSFQQMDSLDSIRSVDSTMSGISVFAELSKNSSDFPNLSRQVTPDGYEKDDERAGGAQEVRSTTTTKTTTTATSTTMATFSTPIPSAATSRERESTTKQPVQTLSSQASGTPIERSTDRMKYQVASSSVATSDKSVSAAHPKTKQKSKRVAAKKATVAKVDKPCIRAPPPASSNGTKKRIRRKEPVVRKYVVATEMDILLGRGGGSNHHNGNIAYRKQILFLQPSYKTLGRDEKTSTSKDVLKWVQTRGGRFLKRECKGSPWYIVTDATARQKVSQALREDHTCEGRALKKSRTTFKCPSKKKMRVALI